MSYSMKISEDKISFDNTRLEGLFAALIAYDPKVHDRLEATKEFKHLPLTLKIHKLSKRAGIELIPADEGKGIQRISWHGVGRIEEDMLHAIAPFVVKDSYIEMTGEDGLIWRYIFDGEKVSTKWPKIVWE